MREHETQGDKLHQRIASFQRESVAPEYGVGQAMTELEHRLLEEHRKRHTSHRELAEQLKRIHAPLADLVSKDERAIEGTRGLREMVSRQQQHKLASPLSPPVKPFITSGSILSLSTKPYDYQWTWGNQGGGGVASEGADKFTGDFGIEASGNNGNALASAGVGTAFHPIAEHELLRFSPLVNYSYQWADTSHIDTAHNDAFMGVYVQQYDLNWQNPQAILDHRISLWSDGTGWFESHSDDGDGHLNDGNQIGIQLYMPVSSNNNYIFWIWCSDSLDDGGDLDSIYWSRSWAQLAANLPFVVFEQYPG
jgi:hypothetical protein